MSSSAENQTYSTAPQELESRASVRPLVAMTLEAGTLCHRNGIPFVLGERTVVQCNPANRPAMLGEIDRARISREQVALMQESQSIVQGAQLQRQTDDQPSH